MARMKLTQEQLDIVLELLPKYDMDINYISRDLQILETRVHCVPVSEQARLTDMSRANVFRRIKVIQECYDKIQADHPEYNLPLRPDKPSKEEKYMNTH